MGLFSGGNGSSDNADNATGVQREEFSQSAINNANAANNSMPIPGRTPVQCQEYSKLFMDCMTLNNNQYEGCKDYMEMMKACQKQYSPS